MKSSRDNMEVLGRYHLLRRIGVGGMAEVFLARSVGEGNFSRLVVVKRMLPQTAEDPVLVEMFLDEARLGSLLHHPNIVPVLDLGRVGRDYFMVMDYVDGGHLASLDNRARSRGATIPVEHLAWMVARAAEGLQAAHEARDPENNKPLGVVHRDVSPSNILLSRRGEVRVADFGVARSQVQENLTMSGVLKGKISYMSPEQLVGDPVDGRSDIFSLGVVLWQLLAGRKRFEERNELRIMQATLKEHAVRPSSVNRLIPPELDAVALQMLERTPKERYQTMREVARDLDRFTNGRGHGGRAEVEAFLLGNLPEAETKPLPGLSPSPPAVADPVSFSLTARLTPAARPPDGGATLGSPNPERPADTEWRRLSVRRVMQSPESRSQLVNGEAVVLSTGTHMVHTLNATATFIWERADGRKTLLQIADELVQTFVVDPKVAHDEVMTFVKAAVDQGFLVFVN